MVRPAPSTSSALLHSVRMAVRPRTQARLPLRQARFASSSSSSSASAGHAGGPPSTTVATGLLAGLLAASGGFAYATGRKPQPEPTPSAKEDEKAAGSEGLANLEEEASQESAFDPVTGKINWDCACLGGMAHGPCGEEFKLAFACFVYSEAEPKGVDCVDKFKGMQDCFRLHPEIYGEEDTDDIDDADLLERAEAALKED